MENDERLSPAARTNQSIGNDDVARYGSPIGSVASELSRNHRRTRPGHYTGAPLTLPSSVLPAVHGRPGHGHTVIRHVTKSETPVSSCHIHDRTTRSLHDLEVYPLTLLKE